MLRLSILTVVVGILLVAPVAGEDEPERPLGGDRDAEDAQPETSGSAADSWEFHVFGRGAWPGSRHAGR